MSDQAQHAAILQLVLLDRQAAIQVCLLLADGFAYLADEQHQLAGLLGDPLGAGLGGVGLVACPCQLAQAHCHALLHLAQPCLHIAPCLPHIHLA